MEVFRQILALSLVFAMLGAALWWLRRRGLAQFGGVRRGAPARPLRSVDRLALSPHHTLHLVKVADRGLVIAAHGAGCTLLDSLPWSSVEADVAQTMGERAAQAGRS